MSRPSVPLSVAFILNTQFALLRTLTEVHAALSLEVSEGGRWMADEMEDARRGWGEVARACEEAALE